MRWLYEHWTVPSSQTGVIDCKRVCGVWNVDVNGCMQSSGYMLNLWKTSIRRLPKKTSVKRILLLGLGAGVTIDFLHRRFPGCNITAVEWDQSMLEVMDRIHLFNPKHRPKILVGDAAQVVPTLNETFDLILFDLFQGPEIPSSVRSSAFFQSLYRLLDRDGFLLVNLYKHTEVLEHVKQSFSYQSSWTFLASTIAMFRPRGRGTLGDPVPEGYVPFRGIKEYLEREIQTEPFTTVVQSGEAYGFRYWCGFFFEKYYCDHEPVFDPASGPKRLVIWQPTTRTDMPPGWGRSFTQMNARLTGFADREAVADPVATWTENTRRQLKRFQSKQADWNMTTITLEEFLRVYRVSGMAPSIVDPLSTRLVKKAQTHGNLLHFFGCVSTKDGTLHGGFAVLDVPEGNQSIHIASFVLPTKAKQDGVGTALIHAWFEYAKEQGIRFLDFDLFRGPHEPKSWEGFSRFKGTFGTIFINYPYPLVRWAGTWRGFWEYLRIILRRS